MQIQKKHVSEHSWLFGWVILNTFAHLAHFALIFFSLIFSAINTYNCSGFNLTNKKDFGDWRWKLGEKWPILTTFFLTAVSALTGTLQWSCLIANIKISRESLVGESVACLTGGHVLWSGATLYVNEFIDSMCLWVSVWLKLSYMLMCIWQNVTCVCLSVTILVYATIVHDIA